MRGFWRWGDSGDGGILEMGFGGVGVGVGVDGGAEKFQDSLGS